MSELLEELAARIAAVSPAWADVVRPHAGALRCTSVPDACSRAVALGIKSIREGWLLHREQSRIAPGADPDVGLLVGDWCYAAGLAEVAEHGSLQHVALLATLIADVSARADRPARELEARWTEAIDAIGLLEVGPLGTTI